jgi:enoyl-CoA hydratase
VLSFDDCMRMEWRLASWIAKGNDFFEDLRALLVEKDNASAWRPGSLKAVSAADVDAYFAPLPGDDFDLSAIMRNA